MTSYVITGASRGLGFTFLTHLANQSPSNIVIGLVRDAEQAKLKLKKHNLDQNPNIHILQADVTDRNALEHARDRVSEITNGKLDVLINNAGYVPWAAGNAKLDLSLDKMRDLEGELRATFEVNVLGVINTTLLFIPLLREGSKKQCLTLSSGVADLEVVADLEISEGVPYAISKAAVNMAVLKFHNNFKGEGLLFFAISPGAVDTGNMDMLVDSELPGKFLKYKPDFQGPATPEESVTLVMKVLESATIEKEGGRMVSQFGNRQWL